MSDTPSDVVIVGGGLCGLRLASLLQQAGREWQLLEARDRIGGRVLSPKEAGTAIDLGPAWFWPGQPRMAALAQDLGLQVFEQYATGMSRFEDAQGRIAQQSGFASMEGALRIASGMGAITDALTASLPHLPPYREAVAAASWRAIPRRASARATWCWPCRPG